MNRQMNSARLALVAGMLATVALAGCEHVKNQLLEPQNPGLVDPAAVGSPTATSPMDPDRHHSEGPRTARTFDQMARRFERADPTTTYRQPRLTAEPLELSSQPAQNAELRRRRR